jgi:hypothetical protein
MVRQKPYKTKSSAGKNQENVQEYVVVSTQGSADPQREPAAVLAPPAPPLRQLNLPNPILDISGTVTDEDTRFFEEYFDMDEILNDYKALEGAPSAVNTSAVHQDVMVSTLEEAGATEASLPAAYPAATQTAENSSNPKVGMSIQNGGFVNHQVNSSFLVSRVDVHHSPEQHRGSMVSLEQPEDEQVPANSNQAQNEPFSFPYQLYELLEDAIPKGFSHIVSWNEDSSFTVHDQNDFVSQVLPAYFSMGKYESFRRQCNLYVSIQQTNQSEDYECSYDLLTCFFSCDDRVLNAAATDGPHIDKPISVATANLSWPRCNAENHRAEEENHR